MTLKKQNVSQRFLSFLQGSELDQVPFMMYDGVIPLDEVWQEFGKGRIGLLRWSAVHKVETPHCKFVTEESQRDGKRLERNTLYTPKGSISEERLYEPVYNSPSIRKHYIEEAQDYEVFWSYLEDSLILPDYERYYTDQKELGEEGLPLPAVERTPYQHLWILWVGLDRLAYHFTDFPDHVEKTIELLNQRERRIFDLVVDSPAKLIDFPDNITAPAIGPKRFRQYCLPLYNELSERLQGTGIVTVVHMDGDLQPLWKLIGESKIGGIDSLSPVPDNDTDVAEALTMWPDKRLMVNFPSSVHLRTYEEVRAVAEEMVRVGLPTGRLEIQISENVPYTRWRTSFKAILDAVTYRINC
jgi:hypothetical protein